MENQRFAMLVSWVSVYAGRALNAQEISNLSHIAEGSPDQIVGLMATITSLQADNDLLRRGIVDVLTAMAQGKAIEAIKLCRQFSGFGLKEAKDLVYDAMNKNREEAA